MRNVSFAFALLSFAACAGHHGTTPGTDELAGESSADDAKADSPYNVHDVQGYLAVTKTGTCTNPITCAPYQLTRVNRATVMCNDGQYHDSCTVKAINFSVLGLSQDQQDAIEAALDAQNADPSIGTQVLVKGTYKIYVDFLAFEASEVWMAQMPSGSTDAGTWVLLSDTGLRCFGDCKEVREEKLNSTRAMAINGMDFGDSFDQQLQIAIGTQERTTQGVIVVGERTEGVGETGATTELRSIDQAFCPVVAASM